MCPYIKSMIILSGSLLSFTSPLSFASTTNLHVAPLDVKTIQVIGDDKNKTHTKYEVDGIEIQLTKEDRIKAHNWNISATDWVKYKYALEYTPRGLWTPNLDPLIVLGNLAKTETERVKYARIMNTIELDRRSREIAFQLTAISVLPQEEIKSPERTALGKALPDEKSVLKSLFVDTETCTSKCIQFMLLEVAGTSSRTKLNIIFTTSNSEKQQTILLGAGITNQKIKDTNISITTNFELTQQYQEKYSFPYLIIQDDAGVTRRDIND